MNSEKSSTKFTNSVFSWSLFGSATQKREKKVRLQFQLTSIWVPTMQIENPYKSILRPAKNVSGIPQRFLCLHWINHLLTCMVFLCYQLQKGGRLQAAVDSRASYPTDIVRGRVGEGVSAVRDNVQILLKVKKRERTFLVWGKIESEALDYNRLPNSYPFLPNYITIASVTILSIALLYS